MSTKVLNGLDLGSQLITNLLDPSSAQDAATKNYVDSAIRGLDWKEAARAATTGNVNLAAAPNALDGVTLAANDRVLVKDQSTGSQNGIYTVTTLGTGANGVWTRSTDADVSAEVTSGMAVSVAEGSANGDKVFILTTNDPIVLNTTALAFTPLGGGGATYTADGQGIEVSSNQFSLELDGTSLSKSATGVRIGTAAAGAGLIESSGILAVGAGTGITVNVNDIAIDPSIVVRRFAVNCSAATTTVCTHNFGTSDVQVTVYRVGSPFDEVIADIEHTSTTQVTVRFASAPTAGQYRIVIFG